MFVPTSNPILACVNPISGAVAVETDGAEAARTLAVLRDVGGAVEYAHAKPYS